MYFLNINLNIIYPGVVVPIQMQLLWNLHTTNIKVRVSDLIGKSSVWCLIILVKTFLRK